MLRDTNKIKILEIKKIAEKNILLSSYMVGHINKFKIKKLNYTL